MNVEAIARALGGDIIGRGQVLAPGPGHSPTDRSMSVLIDPEEPSGFRVNSFAGDDWRACRDHVRARLGWGAAPGNRAPVLDRVRKPRTSSYTEGHRVRLAHELWSEAVPIGSTAAERYLGGRGIALADEALSGAALRFHTSCPFRLQDGATTRLPAMLGAMVDITSNEFAGIHRTAIRPDGGGKADIAGLGTAKKMLGIARNACVKLSADDTVTLGLHVAEGIETALACVSMGLRPCWALLSAGGIARFPVLAGIDAITIMADNDMSGTGLSAARHCARRWAAVGREATILLRPEIGRDWADPIKRVP